MVLRQWNQYREIKQLCKIWLSFRLHEVKKQKKPGNGSRHLAFGGGWWKACDGYEETGSLRPWGACLNEVQEGIHLRVIPCNTLLFLPVSLMALERSHQRMRLNCDHSGCHEHRLRLALKWTFKWSSGCDISPILHVSTPPSAHALNAIKHRAQLLTLTDLIEPGWLDNPCHHHSVASIQKWPLIPFYNSRKQVSVCMIHSELLTLENTWTPHIRQV